MRPFLPMTFPTMFRGTCIDSSLYSNNTRAFFTASSVCTEAKTHTHEHRYHTLDTHRTWNRRESFVSRHLSGDVEGARRLLEVDVGDAVDLARVLDVLPVRADGQAHQVGPDGEALREPGLALQLGRLEDPGNVLRPHHEQGPLFQVPNVHLHEHVGPGVALVRLALRTESTDTRS